MSRKRLVISILLGVVVMAEGVAFAAEVSPEAAVVKSLVFTSSGTDVYAGTGTDGVWKRDTAGASAWANMSTGLDSLNVQQLAIAPGNDSILYAATLGGLFRTVDGGSNWTRVNHVQCHSVAFDPSDSSKIYVGTFGSGLLASSDSGATFTSSATGLLDLGVQAVAVNPVNGDVFIGTEKGGVFRSTDDGSSWTQLITGITDPIPGTVENENLNIAAIGFQPGNNHIWIGSLHPTIVGRAFRSTDGGTTWVAQTIGTGAENNEGVRGFSFFNQNVFYLATRNGVVVSTDGGTTFQNPSWSPGVYNDIQSIAVAPSAVDASGSTLVLGPLGLGVLKSVSGGSSWVRFTAGMTANQVNAVSVASGPGRVIAGLELGGVSSTVDLTTWTQVWDPAGDGTAKNGLEFQANRGTFTIVSIAFAPSDPNVVYAGAKRFGLWKSTDGGLNWIRLPFGSVGSVIDVYAIAVHPTDANTFYAAPFQTGVIKSTNGGASFSTVFSGAKVRSLAISPFNASKVLAGTFDFGVYLTSDAGANWTEQTVVHQGFMRMNFYSVAWDPFGAGNKTAGGTNKGFFGSSDGGANWSLLSNTLNENNITRVLYDPSSANKVYCGTYGGGAFQSTDGGVTWSQVSGTAGSIVLDMAMYGTSLLIATPTGLIRP